MLKRDGYANAREGIEGTAPICYDAEGSQTTLIANLREAELREQGKRDEEIEREIAEGYRAGIFFAPRKPGIAYMLSSENHLHNPRKGQPVKAAWDISIR